MVDWLVECILYELSKSNTNAHTMYTRCPFFFSGSVRFGSARHICFVMLQSWEVPIFFIYLFIFFGTDFCSLRQIRNFSFADHTVLFNLPLDLHLYLRRHLRRAVVRRDIVFPPNHVLRNGVNRFFISSFNDTIKIRIVLRK